MSHYDSEREANQAATKSGYDYHRQAMIDEAINSTGGVYPGGNGCDYLQRLQPFSPVGRYVACRWRMAAGMVHVCTRAEFESRKAERQGKPDWSKSPAWANWLAQDGRGGWWFFKRKPFIEEALFWGEKRGAGLFFTTGEIIGSWQDTLEQRPVAEVKADTHCNEVAAAEREFAGLPTSSQNLLLDIIEKKIIGRKLGKTPAMSVAECRAAIKRAHECCGENVAARAISQESYCNTKRLSELLSAAHPIVSVKPVSLERKPDVAPVTPERDAVLGAASEFRKLPKRLQELLKEPFEEVLAQIESESKAKAEQPPELSFHLVNASNELQASAKLLPAESKLLQSITGVIAAIQAIREAV